MELESVTNMFLGRALAYQFNHRSSSAGRAEFNMKYSIEANNCTLHLRQLTGDGWWLRHVMSHGGLCRPHRRDTGQLWGVWGGVDGLVQSCHGQNELQTVLDPEIASAVLPVLREGEGEK